MPVLFIADLRDPHDPQGRTYRQINAATQHQIPIGALVELPSGIRLFVVHHGRDCDQTPLYYLSADADDRREERLGWLNRSWIGGYSEESLTPIYNVIPEEE